MARIEIGFEAPRGAAYRAAGLWNDEVMGERACCFVVVRPGLSLDFEAMQCHLADAGVSKFKWPERLEIVAAMPLTPTRKIIKARLTQNLFNERGKPDNP